MHTIPQGARSGAGWLGLLIVGFVGCFGCVSAQPRFPPDVQRAINREDMRRLETSEVVLYYPEGTRAETLAVAARLEYCRRELSRLALADSRFSRDKSVFVLPRLPLNNAYLQPTLAGYEQVGVVPQYNTANWFITYGIAPDPGVIGCHEMVHDHGPPDARHALVRQSLARARRALRQRALRKRARARLPGG
jgi:hypothetical protein